MPPVCAVGVRLVGAPGTVAAAARVVSVTDGLDCELPTVVTVRTWNVYSVSAVRLEIVKLGVVELVSVHAPPAVVPVVKRYWYSVIGDPPSSVGAVHERSAVVLVTDADRLCGCAGSGCRRCLGNRCACSAITHTVNGTHTEGVFRPFVKSCQRIRSESATG